MITDQLKTCLADHIESALIVQGYHWNVEGADFVQYHALFGKIYVDIQDQVDILAEYIRIVSDAKEYVNGSVDVVKANKTVSSNFIVGNKSKEMCLEIIRLNDKLIRDIKEVSKSAIDHEGLLNYCADRLNTLNKLNWQLKAITK